VRRGSILSWLFGTNDHLLTRIGLAHTKLFAWTVAAVFADAREGGEEPPFYKPSMLAEESFRGIWRVRIS
jgi:hypothetical protein